MDTWPNKINGRSRIKYYSMHLLSIEGTEAHLLSQSHLITSSPQFFSPLQWLAKQTKSHKKIFLPIHIDSMSLATFQMQSKWGFFLFTLPLWLFTYAGTEHSHSEVRLNKAAFYLSSYFSIWADTGPRILPGKIKNSPPNQVLNNIQSFSKTKGCVTSHTLK